jgi:hypothetical protein
MSHTAVPWESDTSGQLVVAAAAATNSDWKQMDRQHRVTLFINVTVGTCTIQTSEGNDENYSQPIAVYGTGTNMVTLDFSGHFRVQLSDTGRVDFAREEF